MDPIPETARLLAELDAMTASDLTATLRRMALDVARLVPSLAALSLTLGEHGLTLALVAAGGLATERDGVEHLVAVPWVESTPPGTRDAVADVLSEERWAEQAHEASWSGVRTTLTLPLGAPGAPTGALTLYATLPGAFAGQEGGVRRVLGVHGGVAVLNGDVPFRSLADARDAPERLEDHDVVERAVGFVAAMRTVGIDEARTLLRDAASRAAIELAVLARAVLETSGRGGGGCDEIDARDVPPAGA